MRSNKTHGRMDITKKKKNRKIEDWYEEDPILKIDRPSFEVYSIRILEVTPIVLIIVIVIVIIFFL